MRLFVFSRVAFDLYFTYRLYVPFCCSSFFFPVNLFDSKCAGCLFFVFTLFFVFVLFMLLD